ncbi:alpha/beta fold hydrolase [Chryseobacterium salviniae]|uniref:Alpha/beta hydrolase n=1 Tax=Chryseobacterium salviniae TaxID=3101750 RepID=A0ABU6HQH4_9FLAO|nr:alpha/beta hydrolase [Chryseobacterium sp. T9W2-O]MEC3874345.1 alpha/beta hydrolase [Chryseobacterium sp. T9W2-O]
MESQYTDEFLLRNWEGFTNHMIEVNGTKLHYVEGGKGAPLICLPGWPQTFYSFNNIAPELARHFRVIVVDLRGMGTSETPVSGYDKKTMAKDIYELIQALGIQKTFVLGHDIGGMAAMSLAYNFPEVVSRLMIADGLHPNEGMLQMPMIPPAGTFEDKINVNQPYTWWMGFNQIKHLPEKLLEGRYYHLLDWLFHYVMIDESKITEFEKQVYAHAYNDPERIRASNAWYQSFYQDIEDSKDYAKLKMPVLGIASNVSYGFYQYAMPQQAENYEIVHLADTGHYMFEENPNEIIRVIREFLSSDNSGGR